MGMTLSIVSGTYNRFGLLKDMINSARIALPAGINYEFVIIDAGSTDGSLEWLRAQPDVALIEHGEKRGAIKAFCEGAKAARGDYVLMANDDIRFHAFSITRALRHLEDHPYCGGVAFMFNSPLGYITQTMPATIKGNRVDVTYAQVGLFRRWLGDLAGWWGADDPVMGKARIYGADNYLSSRIWEMGYSIDEVPGVAIEDYVPNDTLRQENAQFEGAVHPDSLIYLERYPTGAEIPQAPIYPPDEARKLRILYLPIYEKGFDHQQQGKRGLRQALKRIGYVYEIDYVNSPVSVLRAVWAWQPDLLLCQFHDGDNGTAKELEYWRALAPKMTVVNWNGDARGLTEPSYLKMLRHVDLQLVLNTTCLPTYAQEGIRAAYWQIGYEEPEGPLPAMPSHDVVFLGTRYGKERERMEGMLNGLPYRVGLYGHGWARPAGNTLYKFAEGAALYQNATIAIGDTFPGTRAFVSNRFFQALAAGAFLLQQHSDDLDTLNGFKAGVHYIEWSDLDDLRAKIIDWMAPEKAKEREKIRKAGQRYIREHFSFDAQVQKLFRDLLPLIKEPVNADPVTA